MKVSRAMSRASFVALAAALCLCSCRRPLDEQVVSTEVTGATIVGTLFNAGSAEQAKPTVLVLHGSGSDGRANPFYRALAATFARAGYATFVYDKRGSGSSTGSLMAVPFQQLIDDAVAVAERLKKHPRVDPKRIVIWGGSEGGSIAPEVAVRTRASAVMTQSASGVPFWRQNQFQNIRELRLRGLPEADIANELKVHEAAMDYARTGEGWDRFAAMRAEGSHLRITNPADDIWWKWYGTKLDYEPTKWLKEINVPILAVWGGDDALVPVEESRDSFEHSLSHNRLAELKVFDGADHGLAKNGHLMQLETYVTWMTALLARSLDVPK